MQVVWCDDVKRGELTQPHAPKLGVADTLAHAQSTAERSRIVASLLHLTGFSTFAYFALEFAHERVESLYLHEAFTPATYRGDYVRHNHHDIDPRTLGARVCNMPIVWDLQQLRREHRERDDGPRATPAALDGFLQTMHDDGMCSGIMYSMAVPGTRLHAFMSFTAPRRTREWITPATIEQALSIGLSVHKFASPQLISTSRERAVNASRRSSRSCCSASPKAPPTRRSAGASIPARTTSTITCASCANASASRTGSSSRT